MTSNFLVYFSQFLREKDHVRALVASAEGNNDLMCQIYEDILVDHPLDVLALNSSFFGQFHLGRSRGIRDTVARVAKHYKTSDKYYRYAFAFTLSELSLNCLVFLVSSWEGWPSGTSRTFSLTSR